MNFIYYVLLHEYTAYPTPIPANMAYPMLHILEQRNDSMCVMHKRNTFSITLSLVCPYIRCMAAACSEYMKMFLVKISYIISLHTHITHICEHAKNKITFTAQRKRVLCMRKHSVADKIYYFVFLTLHTFCVIGA